MTESVDTGNLPPKIAADAPAEAQDQLRENEGEKQQLEKQVLREDETITVGSRPHPIDAIVERM